MHYFENNKNFQTFVYDADEISLEALLDPNFRPMTVEEQQQSTRIVYFNEKPKSISSSSAMTPMRYERASFDPSADLPKVAPFSTIPTRRRQFQILSNDSTVIRL